MIVLENLTKETDSERQVLDNLTVAQVYEHVELVRLMEELAETKKALRKAKQAQTFKKSRHGASSTSFHVSSSTTTTIPDPHYATIRKGTRKRQQSPTG